MKKLALFLVLALATLSFSDSYVRGYYRKDGTYVQGHYRSDPDGDVSNNWSTKGNTNPHTGQPGTRTYGGAYDNNGPTGYQGTCQTYYIPGGTDENGYFRAGRYVTKCE